MSDARIVDFDSAALFAALDAKRIERGLSWTGVAHEIWELSEVLNAERNDHPIAAGTLQNLGKRSATSCQHALFMLRWLDRSPESFLVGRATTTPDEALPVAGPDRRLRWHLKRMHAALDEERRARGLTWKETAEEIGCAPNQLTGLKTAKFATNMNLAMRVVQWLGRPAADFVYRSRW